MTTRKKLMSLLKAKYPKMWMKLGEEFSPNNKGAIWTGENSYNGDIPLFDYNAGSWDRSERVYQMGIYKELFLYLEKHGWYCEFYDPGTVLIYQS